MKIGETFIQKAYYGQQLLTSKSAFIGEVPLIEDLQPDIWLPFKGSLDLDQDSKIQNVSGDDGALINWKTRMDIMPDNGGARLTNQSGVLITNWNIPDPIFCAQHSYGGNTIPAANLCAMMWLKLNKTDIDSWFGSGPAYAEHEVKGCYLDNGVMYYDSAHTQPITPASDTIYYTTDWTPYNWTGSAYSRMTYGENGLILGTPDGYSFFGWTFEIEFSSAIRAVRLMLGNRASGKATDIALCRNVVPYDTWFHLTFTVDVSTKKMTAYYNGMNMGSETTQNGFPHWCWAIQAPPWRMMGNYRATKLPFIFKDLRIYGHLLGKEAIKHVYQTTKNT